MSTSSDECRIRTDNHKLTLGSCDSDIEASIVFEKASDLSLRVAANKRDDNRIFVAALISINGADLQALSFPSFHVVEFVNQTQLNQNIERSDRGCGSRQLKENQAMYHFTYLRSERAYDTNFRRCQPT